jgi:hypothetical protein
MRIRCKRSGLACPMAFRRSAIVARGESLFLQLHRLDRVREARFGRYLKTKHEPVEVRVIPRYSETIDTLKEHDFGQLGRTNYPPRIP